MYLGIQNSTGSNIAVEGNSTPPTPYGDNFIAATGISDLRQQTAIEVLSQDIISSGFANKIVALYPFISNSRNYIYTPNSLSIDYANSGIGNPSSVVGSLTFTNDPNPVDGDLGIANLNPNAGAKTGATNNGVITYNGIRFTSINRLFNTNLSRGIIIDATNGNVVNTPGIGIEYGVINTGSGWFRLWMKTGFNTYSVYVKCTTAPYILFYFNNFNLIIGPSNDINFDNTSFVGTEQLLIYGLQSEVNTIQTFGFGQPTPYQKNAYNVDPASNMAYCYRINFMNPLSYPLSYSGVLNYWVYGLGNNGGIIDTGIVPSAIAGMNNAMGAVRLSSAGTGGSFGNSTGIIIHPFYLGVNDRIFGASKVTGGSYFEMCPCDFSSNAMFFGVNSNYGNSLYPGTPTDLYNGIKRSTGYAFIKGVKDNTLFTNGSPFSATVDRSVYLGSSNQGSSVLLSRKIMSCAAFGIDLTDAELLALRDIMQNYNIFLNRQ